jgi:hypothetical protein
VHCAPSDRRSKCLALSFVFRRRPFQISARNRDWVFSWFSSVTSGNCQDSNFNYVTTANFYN